MFEAKLNYIGYKMNIETQNYVNGDEENVIGSFEEQKFSDNDDNTTLTTSPPPSGIKFYTGTKVGSGARFSA